MHTQQILALRGYWETKAINTRTKGVGEAPKATEAESRTMDSPPKQTEPFCNRCQNSPDHHQPAS